MLFRSIPPGKRKGTVNRGKMESAPPEVRTSAVHRTFGTVKRFMKEKDWNSITLGGSDKKNKQLYRDVGDRMEQESEGKIKSHHIPGAGVKITRTQKIENPKVSEYTPLPSRREDPARIPRKQISRKDQKVLSKGEKYEPSGKSGPSGPKKKKDIGSEIDALSGSSEASSVAKE